jgi:hypothetical protein
MDKQNKRIILRVDNELKELFTKKANDNHMKISARIKYLMKMDVQDKLKIK